MKHPLLRVSFFILIAAIISACSSTEQANVDEKKYYSNDTLDFFNRIENTRSNSFNNSQYSRPKKRNDDLDESERIESVVIDRNLPRQTNTPSSPSRRAAPARPNLESHQQVAPKSKPQKQIITETSNESLIEIQQHLSYYCMDSKNLRRFKNSQAQCENHGLTILEACTKTTGTVNKKTVNCVIQKLKNG